MSKTSRGSADKPQSLRLRWMLRRPVVTQLGSAFEEVWGKGTGRLFLDELEKSSRPGRTFRLLGTGVLPKMNMSMLAGAVMVVLFASAGLRGVAFVVLTLLVVLVVLYFKSPQNRTRDLARDDMADAFFTGAFSAAKSRYSDATTWLIDAMYVQRLLESPALMSATHDWEVLGRPKNPRGVIEENAPELYTGYREAALALVRQLEADPLVFKVEPLHQAPALAKAAVQATVEDEQVRQVCLSLIHDQASPVPTLRELVEFATLVVHQ